MKMLYFVIGTEAELLKMFPTMLILNQRHLPYKIIATGQNDISHSSFLQLVNDGRIDIDISKKSQFKKNVFGLLNWYFSTELNGRKVLKKLLHGQESQSFFVVHGDTLTTVMGSRLATYLQIPYAHVEAGYRSWNWFNPLPEEFDRTYSSRRAKLIFAPGKNLIANLEKVHNGGQKINTFYNTNLDTLTYVLKHAAKKRITTQPYFVLSIHRQENLLHKSFLQQVVNNILTLSEKITCLLFLHEQTKVALEKFGLLALLKNNSHIIIYPRQPLSKFLQILNQSEFMITDGAGNQQEVAYLGKPCLLLRYHTEGYEGLDKNIVLFAGDFNQIATFDQTYKKYQYPPLKLARQHSPSQIIADALKKEINSPNVQ